MYLAIPQAKIILALLFCATQQINMHTTTDRTNN